MATVRCPDCGSHVPVPAGVRAGDVIDCPGCAGHGLRLEWRGNSWTAALAYRVSCPRCEELITLPADANPADVVECCGKPYRLTFEYGAFAAEEL